MTNSLQKPEIEHHVVSLELAKKLKAAWYPQESLFYWRILEEKSDLFFCGFTDIKKWKEEMNGNLLAAPLASELGEQLPAGLHVVPKKVEDWNDWANLMIARFEDRWTPTYDSIATGIYLEVEGEKTLPNALATMWLYLKERGVL